MGTCKQENCTDTSTIECRMIDGLIDGQYCRHHAQLNGFCFWCGDFAAGTEAFDFIVPGLCEPCQEGLRAEEWDDEEEEFWHV